MKNIRRVGLSAACIAAVSATVALTAPFAAADTTAGAQPVTTSPVDTTVPTPSTSTPSTSGGTGSASDLVPVLSALSGLFSGSSSSARVS